jgi:hypothetical protein
MKEWVQPCEQTIGQIEVGGIELNGIDEVAAQCRDVIDDGSARGQRVFRRQEPAAGRHILAGVHGGGDVGPETIGRRRAGEDTTHPDDGDARVRLHTRLSPVHGTVAGVSRLRRKARCKAGSRTHS